MSKSITITLSDDQIAQLDAIRSTRMDRTEVEILEQVIERGIYALAYRTKYNKVKYTREAGMREEFKAFKAMRKQANSK